jgi:hypothetical protein
MPLHACDFSHLRQVLTPHVCSANVQGAGVEAVLWMLGMPWELWMHWTSMLVRVCVPSLSVGGETDLPKSDEVEWSPE